jgi:hypothetical protein
MNIIFGADNAARATNKHIVLELDSVMVSPTAEPLVTYGLIERVPLHDMANIASLSDLHANLIKEYKKQNWKFCEDAIEHLQGAWNNELDSFYIDLYNRIQTNKTQTLDDAWTAALVRY